MLKTQRFKIRNIGFFCTRTLHMTGKLRDCQGPTVRSLITHLARTPLLQLRLEAIPADDWHRTWAAGRTIMLRRTSKRVKEQVDKMLLPVVVRFRTTFSGCMQTSSSVFRKAVIGHGQLLYLPKDWWHEVPLAYSDTYASFSSS